MEMVNTVIYYVGLFVEYVGLAMVVVSIFVAFFRLPMKKYTMENVRVNLARKIIFGLEFVIAADILLVTVATNIEDIVKLGAIVFIRVLLGYSLRKEVIK